MVARGNCVVLAGAGLSTGSGIPDYRGPKTRMKTRNPMRFRTFMSDPENRRRYWARSAVGWPRFRLAEPNAGHAALAALESQGLLAGVITQNVDGLHQRAGASNVIELHGALSQVRCMDCEVIEHRDAMQDRLLDANPGFEAVTTDYAPDGDATVAPSVIDSFRTVGCSLCGGILKPDVVFFGENVPKVRVDASFALFERARSLLIVGSSLSVFSGYRFVLHAQRIGVPSALINFGPPHRGLDRIGTHLDADLTSTLPAIAAWAGR